MSHRLLIVQDDESLGQSLQDPPGLDQENIDPDGVEPVVAASGEEALLLLDRESFDTLLVDLNLRDMDGLELLVRAKQLRPGVKTLALSSASSPELHAAALDSGADEILRKPLDRETLLQTLANGKGKPGRLASLGGDFDIADLCLLGALSGRNGGIQAGKNGSTSSLVVEDGALVHASSGDLQGLAAFKQVLSWKRLEFDWIPPATARHLPPNVRLDTSWLLKIAHWRQNPEAQAPEACRADGLLSGVHLQDLLNLLEKKQETGMITVAAAGRVGALMLRDGQIVQADTDEQHGHEAIQEILAWSTLRATYSRTAAVPLTRGEETAMADIERLIDEMSGELSGVLSAGVVRLSDGWSLAERSSDPIFTSSLAAYAPVVRSHVQAAERMADPGRLGSTEDLLIFLEKAFLLVRLLGPDHFQALLLDKPANPALARLVMQQYEPLLLEALGRA